MGLLITLLLGLFIILGAVITILSKNNHKFISFSISMALSVIIMIIITDLIPEISDIVKVSDGKFVDVILILISIITGFSILKLLDIFIPEHDKKNNLGHIGIISAIALILHNIIEGMAVYSTVSTSIKSGLLITIGVGLHNIPLGMVIASTLYNNNNAKKMWIIISIISLSTLFGGIIMFLLQGLLINELLLGILLSITMGMLIYIVVIELIPKVMHMQEKKIASIGLILGIVIVWFANYF